MNEHVGGIELGTTCVKQQPGSTEGNRRLRLQLSATRRLAVGVLLRRDEILRSSE